MSDFAICCCRRGRSAGTRYVLFRAAIGLAVLGIAFLGLACGSVRAAASPAGDPPVVLEPFAGAAAWKPADDSGNGRAAINGTGPAGHPLPASLNGGAEPGNSLKVHLDLPSAAGIRLTPGAAWSDLSRMKFGVYLPVDAPESLSLGIYVKDNEWWWYENFPLKAHAQSVGGPELIPGRWNEVMVDFGPHAEGWAPGGHTKPWVDALRPFLEVGLMFYSKTPFHGSVEISPLRGWNGYGAELADAPLKVESTDLASDVVGQWKPETFTVHLNRRYPNPFDPAVVDLEGHFQGPMGDVDIPGFFYQGYAPVKGGPQTAPAGETCWKVRFTPTRPGRYTYAVTLKDGSGTTTLTSGHFECRAEHDPGFVRIDDADHRFFSFDDASWYYPIGLNVRHAGDEKNVHEGMPAIEHYFDKMASVGLNWTRTWMASWWLGIEWSHDYDARYHGVGRYNLSNAWLLDQTLDVAARDGLYVDLTLNNHGQFSRKSDPEWEYNPYSAEPPNHGHLQEPAEFFTDPWARKMFQQRLRYIVARWGYSPHIFAWELFNEVDLTEGYKSQVVSDWMSEMADYLHSIDPWQHLVSTHVCWWTADPVLWSNPKLQFVQCDAYVRWTHGQDTMATFTDKVWRHKAQFDKPAYIVEFGYKGYKEPADLERDPIPQFHPGIWAGFVSPFSADSMFWDWYVVDRQNLWPQYAALVRFARGEDRRGQNLRVSLCSVQADAPLEANAINNENRAYVWVYNSDRQGETDPSAFAPVTGAKLLLEGLDDGDYTVQFWDTWKGVPVGEVRAHSSNSQVMVPLPPIRIDLAIKIRKAG